MALALDPDRLLAQVHAIRKEAVDILSFDLRPASEASFPAFTAGSHIDVHLPNSLVRSYSLANPPAERNRYVLTVAKDRNSRGGSAFMHSNMRVGDTLPISRPRNNFALEESAPHSVLLAGGIGITPFLGMIHRLECLGAPWDLYYATRSAHFAAYLDDLRALAAKANGRVYFNFDDENQGRFFDLRQIVAGAPAESHFYCCGPAPMIEAFRAATGDVSPGRIHFEYFASSTQPCTTGGFQVELALSQRIIPVPPGKTILNTLLDEGIFVPYSCTEGICAACETRVLSGVPDHRDLVLSSEERARNDRMMICCSGSKSSVLVLDL